MKQPARHTIVFPDDDLVFCVSEDEAELLQRRHRLTEPQAPIIFYPTPFEILADGRRRQATAALHHDSRQPELEYALTFSAIAG